MVSSAPEGHKHVFFNRGLRATSILGVLERRSGRVSCTGWERMASTALGVACATDPASFARFLFNAGERSPRSFPPPGRRKMTHV